MAITVLNRPEKTLENGFISRWSASALPLKFTLESDLFPTNNVDTVFTITNVAYSLIEKGIQITFSVPHNYNTNQYVFLSGTGIESLDNKNFRIKSVPTIGDIVIDFFSSETSLVGTSVRYYNNYKGLVKVFEGARENHPYDIDGSKPLTEIGVIEVDFRDVNGSNEGLVNVRSFVKPGMNANFDYNDENSHFAWTSYHIQIAETYEDPSDPTGVFTSDFEDDDYDNCVPFVGYTNDSFDLGLTDWLQIDLFAGNDVWVAGVGEVTCSLDVQGIVLPEASKILYQNVQLVAGNEYIIDVDLSWTGAPASPSIKILVFGVNGVSLTELTSKTAPSNGVYQLIFTPSNNHQGVGIQISGITFGTNADITLLSQQITFNGTIESICNAYNYTIFGAKQFQDDLGGNFGDYVLNVVDEFVTPKILTHFNELRFFYGKPFYLNAIIPSSTFSLSEDENNLFVLISLFDSSGNSVLSFDYKIESFKDGVYTVDPDIKSQLDFNNIQPCDWSYGTARYIIIPTNSFVDAQNGTFEVDPIPLGITLLNGSLPEIGSAIFNTNQPRTGLASAIVQTDATQMTDPSMLYPIFQNDTSINIVEGRTYEITGYIALRDVNVETRQINNGSIFFLPDGYVESEMDSITFFEIIPDNLYTDASPVFNDFKVTKTIFTAKSDASIIVRLYEKLKTNIPSFTGCNFNIDDITFKGPYEFISEEKQIVNSCDCEPYTAVIRWKNDLGGWDVWNFTARKTITERTSNIITTEKDLTVDWDNQFINGDTQFDTISIDSRESITIRSQPLTQDELTNLNRLRRSIRVQLLMRSGKWQTVTINTGSFLVIDEGEKRREITFDIDLPKKVIQNQ